MRKFEFPVSRGRMTGSAFRCWMLWLNTIVSKGGGLGRREAKYSLRWGEIGDGLECSRFSGGGSKSVAGAIL